MSDIEERIEMIKKELYELRCKEAFSEESEKEKIHFQLKEKRKELAKLMLEIKLNEKGRGR